MASQPTLFIWGGVARWRSTAERMTEIQILAGYRGHEHPSMHEI